ncbi:MFS transporter [Paenibacillus thermotolerans]|uniref:MFS transporter n=1 Tax=Paenibacillus thermotolerans TaxID=3027807 RepID=UPI002367AC14|nr:MULTISPECIES: MFS transporter [unclassified Paenibacillus]
MDKRLPIILFMVFTIFLGFGIIIPVLPAMIVGSGAERFHLYVMLAAYSAASFLMSPFWGELSDRLGRRPVLLMGVAGFSVSFLLFGLSSGHLGLMYASRILGGIFSGAATSCAVAYIADITSEEKRTRSMGLIGMSIGLGFIFGPGIGGALSNFGTAVPFFVASGVALVNFLFALFSLPESVSAEERRKHAAKEKVSRWTAFEGPIRYLFVLSFIVTFTLAGLESVLQYFSMERFGATPEQFGYMMLISGVVGALMQGGFVRKFAKKGTEPGLIRAGLLISAAGFVLLLFSRDFLTTSLFLCVFSIGNSLLRPCVTSLITQTTTAGQGLTGGLNSSMDSLGRIAGPLIAGGVFELKSAFPFLLGAVFCIGGLLLLQQFLTLIKRRAGSAA